MNVKQVLHAYWKVGLSFLFGLAVALFWALPYVSALSFQEQYQLFLWTPAYFLQRLSVPGGLADYPVLLCARCRCHHLGPSPVCFAKSGVASGQSVWSQVAMVPVEFCSCLCLVGLYGRSKRHVKFCCLLAGGFLADVGLPVYRPS